MNKLYTKLKLLYSDISSNIAFYPSLISFFGAGLGVFMLYIEQGEISTTLLEVAPSLAINDVSTARTLLSTFIGGIISIMVFSFSMVMLLLNQASNSYSPRILPGLISNKRNQAILGFYIATIIYNILILISLEPSDGKYGLPGLSILIGLIFGILVLPAFIYFINSISQSIQINNIINNIHLTASTRLKSLIDKDQDLQPISTFDNTDNWTTHTLEISGNLSDVAYESMLKLGTDTDSKFELLVAKGSFVFEDTPIIKVSNDLDEEQMKKLKSCFGFSRNEIVSNNYLLGFKQLTEIALKAMSPGINDPGTAVTCIDYLTELFIIRMSKNDQSYITDQDNNAIIKVKIVPFSELTYNVLAPLRQYCKADFIMMSKILYAMRSLLKAAKSTSEYKTIIKQQIELVMEDAHKEISNTTDLNRLKAIYTSTLEI